jgi:ferredoxin-NADP reductase
MGRLNKNRARVKQSAKYDDYAALHENAANAFTGSSRDLKAEAAHAQELLDANRDQLTKDRYRRIDILTRMIANHSPIPTTFGAIPPERLLDAMQRELAHLKKGVDAAEYEAFQQERAA